MPKGQESDTWHTEAAAPRAVSPGICGERAIGEGQGYLRGNIKDLGQDTQGFGFKGKGRVVLNPEPSHGKSAGRGDMWVCGGYQGCFEDFGPNRSGYQG